MKKKIIFGSLLAVFVLMVLPSVSAVEFNTAVETNKSQILKQLQDMTVDEFREKIKTLDIKELEEKTQTYSLFEWIIFLISSFIFVYLLPIIVIPMLVIVFLIGGILGWELPPIDTP